MRIRSAALVPFLVLLHASSASAQLASVDELRVSYGAFVDEFDDGVFPDGSEGKPLLYSVPCGVVTDADESGGRLLLAGPDPACDVPGLVGENVAGNFAAAGDLEVTGTFVGQVPALDQAYGVMVNDLMGADFATVQVARALVQGTDTVLVVLVDETFSVLPVAAAVLGPAATYVAPAGIEVRLSLALAADGSELEPQGAYRECPALPCASDIPFTLLQAIPGGGGGLAAGVFHVPGFLAVDVSGDVVPTPFAYELDRFEVRYDEIVDDFEDGVIGHPIPYGQAMGTAVEEQGGVLKLSNPDPGFGFAAVGLDASSPTEVVAEARFRFQLPSACGYYGLSMVAPPFFPFQDVAQLKVVRGLLPGAGDDALGVIAQSESESQIQLDPIFELALISEQPGSDPSLASVVAIELELSLAEEPTLPSVGPLPITPRYRPHGRYRLCESEDCAGAAFVDLDPALAIDPGVLVCGTPASAFAPPVDGGLVDSGEAVSVAMVAAPEPEAALAGTLALLAAATLARARSLRPRA